MNQTATHTAPPTVQVIKASLELQRRVGKGALDSLTIHLAQQAMTTNGTDFAPVAAEFLKKLQVAIQHARDTEAPMATRVEGMTRPVMDLKANAKMFGYDLVTMLANIMLGFLEATPEIDNDAVEIVAAHHRTLKAIIDKKMTGDGGPSGTLLVQELKDACNRYFAKRHMRPINVAMI